MQNARITRKYRVRKTREIYRAIAAQPEENRFSVRESRGAPHLLRGSRSARSPVSRAESHNIRSENKSTECTRAFARRGARRAKIRSRRDSEGGKIRISPRREATRARIRQQVSLPLEIYVTVQDGNSDHPRDAGRGKMFGSKISRSLSLDENSL